MRLISVTLLTTVFVTPAVAQTSSVRAGGAEFFGFRTYWSEKGDGCKPMISLSIKNISSGDIGAIAIRMKILDKDNKSVFASGSAVVPSADLLPGKTKQIAVGGDHDITPHDCLGDMHEVALSTIHFAVDLTATVGADPAPVELVRDDPMTEERVPAQN